MTADITNAYALAHLADVASPDEHDSAGAKWLVNVASWIGESDVDWTDYDSVADWAAGRADECVPIYTHERWLVFVDLCAYNEDIEDYGQQEDMTAAAGIALYVIAERLLYALAEEIREAIEQEQEDADSGDDT